MQRENLKIVSGVANLEWKRRSAAELDWMWVRHWFEVGLEEKKLESGIADLRLWVRCWVGLKFVGAPLSGSSTVGMGLFSSCLVRLEEKKLERQTWDRDRTWDRVGRRRDKAREKHWWRLIHYFLFCFVLFFCFFVFGLYI